MRRIAALVAVLAAALGITVPEALAAQGPKDKDTHVQLLGFNDFHGHLEPNTPGSIQVGCCNPVVNASGVQTGWAARTVPAGGAEYLATHIKSLRTANTNIGGLSAEFKSVAANLNSSLEELKPTLSNFRSLSDSLKMIQLNSTINKTQQSLSKLNESLTRLNNGDNTMSKLLTEDTLYVNLNRLLYSLDSLAKHFNENPRHFLAPLGKSQKRIQRDLKRKEEERKNAKKD